MKDQTYDITLRVTADRVATIMQLLDKEATLVKCEPTPEPVTPSGRPRRRVYANGNRLKDVNGLELAFEFIKKGGIAGTTRDELVSVFVEKGFASKSADSRIHDLVRSGKVTRSPTGLLRIA